MISVKKLLVLATLTSSISFTGCGNDSTSTVNKQQNISNTTATTDTSLKLEPALKENDWKLLDARDSSNTKISAFSNINKKKTFLSFKNANNNRLYFGVGCNHNSAVYTLSTNNTLSTNDITGNGIVCDALEAPENKLIEILSQKIQLSITETGKNKILTMTLANGTKLTWEPRAKQSYAKDNEAITSNLRKYNWILQDASQTDGNPESSALGEITELEAIKDKVKISINGDMLGYTTGCHQQSTNFELADKAILKLSNLSSNVMSCNTSVQTADNMLDQIMQQDTKIVMTLGEIPSFTQTTQNGRLRILTWEAVDKSKVDLNTSIDQFNWKLTNALKQNSPVDSYLSTIPELVNVKDKITLAFSFTPAHISYFDNRIRYGAGCNSYTGKFVIDQTDALNVSDVQMTEKACANATASAEAMLNDIMQKGGKLVMTMDNAVPTLKFTSGNADSSFETLVWQSTVK